MLSVLRDLERFSRLMFERFNADRLMQVAGALAFTTLLSIVPLVTVALALLTKYPVFGQLTEALTSFLTENLLPESAGMTIVDYVLQFAQKANTLTQIGSIMLLATAVSTLLTIDHAFNAIWRVAKLRPLWRRVLVYSLVITVGPILLGASIAVSSYLISLSLGLVTESHWLAALLIRAASLGLLCVLFTLLYFAVPYQAVALRDALIGGIVATAAFVLMQRLFAWSVASFPTYDLIYGAFAAIPIFLMWLYLSWIVVLLGALLVATLQEFREPPSPG